jgi:outer membrane protein insertion porin family
MTDTPFIKRFIGILLFLITFCSISIAQNVVFEGLKRTKATYLRKFIGWETRVPTDSARIVKALSLIRNTRFFNDVSYSISTQGTDTLITFKCQEIHTALPLFELGASKGNEWIRLGVEDENGLGRGIRSIVFYQYNDRHSFYLKQAYPLVFKKWGLNYLVKKWSVLEPVKLNDERNDFRYTNIDAEITTQYAFDINRHDIEFGVGYMKEIYALPMDEGGGKMVDMYRFDRMILKGNHQINQLNYTTFYLNGWANKFNFMASYDPIHATTFGFIANETTYFKTLPAKGNLAFRGRLGISTNNNVFLAPFILDNYYNIRSIGNKVDRGTASLAVNVEYRQTLWENKLFGFQAVGFTDAGTWRLPDGQLSDMLTSKNMKIFAGIGGRFIYKKAYDAIVRLDYGYGIKGEGKGFVFGLGQYF